MIMFKFNCKIHYILEIVILRLHVIWPVWEVKKRPSQEGVTIKFLKYIKMMASHDLLCWVCAPCTGLHGSMQSGTNQCILNHLTWKNSHCLTNLFLLNWPWKCYKSIFWTAFGVPIIQTLVKINNNPQYLKLVKTSLVDLQKMYKS